MNADAIALFRELANRSPSERQEYYARHKVPDTLRVDVESLLRFDDATDDSLRDCVAATAGSVTRRQPLQSGARLGRYEVIAAAGAGGMGEVYKAKDTRLDRIVAIKILPPHVAGDTAVRQRFEREAKLLAGLSHPHICPVFDVGHEENTDFLVMEYLKGETLAQRLAKGALPLDEGLRYAIQVADALDKAHGAGIIHRDVKPGNIMLTTSGAKLLDFGLAKLLSPLARGTAAPAPATSSLTTRGTIVGTVQYMAPEQLEGGAVDARTDIFAFGAVVYEMLTGKKAFEGKSDASVIAAIMGTDPPPIAAAQPLAPPLLDHLVRSCLAKDPQRRWQAAADAMRELTWIAEGNIGRVTAPPPRRKYLPWIVAATAITVAGVSGVGTLRVSPNAESPIRFLVTSPETTTFPNSSAFFAVSPNGSSLVFVAANSSAKTQLWLRPLDSTAARPLLGTDDANNPFWSPDNRLVAFYAEGKLKTVDVADGHVRSICDVPNISFARGGAWSPSGVILFQRNYGHPLYRVSASGGTPAPATVLAQSRGELSHTWPSFLPDGRHFVYSAVSGGQAGGVFVGSLDSTEVKRLLDAPSAALYASGHLLFGVDGSLMAQRFDERTLQLEGEPTRLAEHVIFNPSNWRTAFSVSQTGVLAYRGGAVFTQSQLLWVDRTGKPSAPISDSGQRLSVNLSRDGGRIALDRSDPQTGRWDIWLIDVSRGATSRLTTHHGHDAYPVWSPDGADIVFSSARDDPGEEFDSLYVKPSNGLGDEEPILKLGQERIHQHPVDWSLDGRYVLFEKNQNGVPIDLWMLPMFGNRTPSPLVATEFDERAGQFSPDGRLVTYMSNETGRYEVYVRSISGAAGKWQISVTGGGHPRWSSNGREIFYIGPDHSLMAVPLNTKGRFEPGPPARLFTLPVDPAIRESMTPYAVAPEGRRFLLMGRLPLDAPVTVHVNWPTALTGQR